MKTNIYMVKCGNYVKIGKAKDVQKRLSQLQIGSPQKLELIGSTFVDEAMEFYLHNKLEKYRVRGEWFVDCKEVQNEFISLQLDSINKLIDSCVIKLDKMTKRTAE